MTYAGQPTFMNVRFLQHHFHWVLDESISKSLEIPIFFLSDCAFFQSDHISCFDYKEMHQKGTFIRSISEKRINFWGFFCLQLMISFQNQKIYTVMKLRLQTLTKQALHEWGDFEWRHQTLKMLLHSNIQTLWGLSNEILCIFVTQGAGKWQEVKVGGPKRFLYGQIWTLFT